MLISDFYYYIFGDRAIFRGKRRTLSPDEAQAEKEKFEEEIRKKFQPILQQAPNAYNLRILLQQLNNDKLEKILFPHSPPILKITKSLFPSDEEIENKFTEFDTQYHLTTKFRHRAELKEKFMILFKGAKLVADLLEENNAYNNSVAYQHALKMLILFGLNGTQSNPFSALERFQGTYVGNAATPLHDTLIYPIPDNVEMVHWKAWGQIFQSDGFPAIKLFQQALEVESRLGNRAPKKMQKRFVLNQKSNIKKQKRISP